MRFKICSFFLIILSLSCEKPEEQKPKYNDHIGDTSFDFKQDNPEFQFCDSTNVLHKRAYIHYTGGINAMEDEILKQFIFKPEYASFSGYIIIRFAVNCNDEAGRFRTEVLDQKFNLATCPKNLEQHITDTFKSLKHWNHAVYRGKHYDGYKFHCLKIVNGKIQKS